MAGIRTFVAIELPTSVQAVCSRSQQALAALLQPEGLAQSIRWTGADKIHLTLRFLGDSTPEQIARLRAALVTSLQTARPFSLELGPLGCFPNCRAPRVVWLGVGGELAMLNALQSQVEAAAVRAGFPADSQAYRPHLTIGRAARRSSRADVRRLGALLAGVAPGRIPGLDAEISASSTFPVRAVAHIESKLQPAGSVYTRLYQIPLRP